MFNEQLQSLDEAFALIANNSCIVTAMAASEPQLFFTNAADELREHRGLTIYCANPSKSYAIFSDESLESSLELRPMFLTSEVSYHQTKRHIHYVPQHLSQWSSNLLQNNTIDVFWGSCSVPDKRGFVSIGPSACYEYDIIKEAKYVILEVNPNIPLTHGSTFVPLSRIDCLVESDKNVPNYSNQAHDSIDEQIAQNVAELIPNEATIQLGIGSIPNALAYALQNKKDLGVHTEMMNDTIVELYKKGVITGRAKTLWPDKIIAAFAFGSPKLYDFLNNNPLVELHPAAIVNDPVRIGRNHRMFSINSAVEVDLTGQVCSESVGHLELSGVGGATDTHIGAQRAQGGQGIIAMKSITKKGVPKIVAELRPGAKVSISRNDIDTVVTEYGIARLKGKTVRQRSENLIAISHPSQRDKLTRAAKKFGYL